MKRYRIFGFALDSRRNYPEVLRVAEDVAAHFGEAKKEEKYGRFMSLKKPGLMVIGEYSYILEDISNAYVAGSFYSALTGACCLGERIFNDIIIRVRDEYKSSPWYGGVYRKDSIIAWEKAINILRDWEIAKEEVEQAFRRLCKLRTDSVHYQSKEQDIAVMSLEAINLINLIVGELFGALRKDILLVFDSPGEIFIRKEAEQTPFVKAFFLPSAAYLGYKFQTSADHDGVLRIVDNEDYDDQEVSDEEFIRLRIDHNQSARNQPKT